MSFAHVGSTPTDGTNLCQKSSRKQPKPAVEEEQNEREVEALMAPLRELTNCDVFRYTNLWQVIVEWKEPELDLDSRPIKENDPRRETASW